MFVTLGSTRRAGTSGAALTTSLDTDDIKIEAHQTLEDLVNNNELPQNLIIGAIEYASAAIRLDANNDVRINFQSDGLKFFGGASGWTLWVKGGAIQANKSFTFKKAI